MNEQITDWYKEAKKSYHADNVAYVCLIYWLGQLK
jgi:hypothetical protein